MQPEKYDDLSKLARGIRDHHQAARSLAAQSRDKLAQAVAEIALAGQKLNTVKKILPHGDFLPWLKKHCKGVSEDTAQRYMRVAKTAHVRDLKSAASIRQAYLICGIVKAPEAAAVDQSARFRLPALSSIAKLKPEQWEAGEIALFERWFTEQVEPVIAIRERLRQSPAEITI